MARENRDDPVTRLVMARRLEAIERTDVSADTRRAFLYQVDMMEVFLRRLQATKGEGSGGHMLAMAETLSNVASMLATCALTLNLGDERLAAGMLVEVILPELKKMTDEKITRDPLDIKF
jgi:hypothetical protein